MEGIGLPAWWRVPQHACGREISVDPLCVFSVQPPACRLACRLQKCGTTSLAELLKRHPALSGVDGLPYHEALSKESHFFEGRGVAGRAGGRGA